MTEPDPAHTPEPAREPTPTPPHTAVTRVFPDCVPTLAGKGIVLRAHTEADVARIVEQSRDPMSQRFIPLPFPYEESDARGYLEHVARSGWERGNLREFAIDEILPDSTRRFVGNVALGSRDNGRYELGFVLHPDARGHGVITRAADRLLTYAFDELDAQVILWRALTGNKGSRRVAQKLGFSICAQPLRKWGVFKGELVDEWQGTLVRHDHRPIIT